MSHIFRDDDINPSSDYGKLSETYNVIKSQFSEAKILSCVTLFSKYNDLGSVYKEVPFKHKPKPWFYDVDKFLLEWDIITKEYLVSHGLFHVNHANLSRDAQEMSILGSCKFLKTNLFCAPFNAFNQITQEICAENDIKIINSMFQWRSLERENFDPSHKYWYMHSWRLGPEELRKKLTNVSKLNN
jgi:hypothetical protein